AHDQRTCTGQYLCRICGASTMDHSARPAFAVRPARGGSRGPRPFGIRRLGPYDPQPGLLALAFRRFDSRSLLHWPDHGLDDGPEDSHAPRRESQPSISLDSRVFAGNLRLVPGLFNAGAKADGKLRAIRYSARVEPYLCRFAGSVDLPGSALPHKTAGVIPGW